METRIYTVTKVGKTRNQKGYVCFDGSADYIFLGKTDPPPLNAMIEVEMTSLPARSGDGVTWFLNDWRLSRVQPSVSALRPPMEAPAAPAPYVPSPPPAIDEAALRFISNCVGSAIGAGQLTKPDEITAWAKAAQNALQSLEKGPGF